jgi:hypothetical protein
VALLGGCGTLLGIDGDYFEVTDAGPRVDGSDLDAQAGSDATDAGSDRFTFDSGRESGVETGPPQPLCDAGDASWTGFRTARSGGVSPTGDVPWTLPDVNGSDFGVALRAHYKESTSSTASVDAIRMGITYCP